MRAFFASATLALLLVLASGSALAHVRPGHGGATCGGVAPAVTSCSTGEHLNTWSAYLELDFSGTRSNYTGTLEATLTQDGGTYTLRCDFVAGVSSGCVTSGTPPGLGTLYTHECRSFDSGTTTPGGSGQWGCRIYHTSL